MAAMNTLGYGTKRIDNNYGKRKGCGRYYVFFILAVLIIGGVWYILRSGKRGGAAADATAPGEQTPVAVQVQSGKPMAFADPDAQRPVASQQKTYPETMRLCAEAEKLFADGQYPQAREMALKALASVDDDASPEWDKAARILGRINIRIFTTNCPLPGKKERYVVQRGDFLQRLASKFNTTVPAIQQANGISLNSNSIMVGQTLFIYHGDWRIKVSKSRYKLYLYDGDELFKLYDVSIGKQDRTPVGSFKISSRTLNPDWYAPNGEKIPFGDERNVLGTRWLRLTATEAGGEDLTGYGIHGTWERDSIGQSRSNGCIRMLNEDVEELYSIVPINTVVTIED